MRPSRTETRIEVMVLGIVSILLLAAGPAPKKTPSGTATPPGVSRPAVKSKTARTLTFDSLKIEGRIPRPQAIYKLERSRTSFGDLEPDDDFLPRILDSVEGDPF